MRILGVSFDDGAEVRDSVLVVVDHLVALGSFMQVTNIGWQTIDATRERPDCLLELLDTSVG